MQDQSDDQRQWKNHDSCCAAIHLLIGSENCLQGARPIPWAPIRERNFGDFFHERHPTGGLERPPVHEVENAKSCRGKHQELDKVAFGPSYVHVPQLGREEGKVDRDCLKPFTEARNVEWTEVERHLESEHLEQLAQKSTEGDLEDTGSDDPPFSV